MQEINIKGIPLFRFSIFPDNHLFHFTTTIQGGISKGPYSTFNLGAYCGDNLEDVIENRNLLSSVINIDSNKIYVPYQTHGDKIRIIDKSFLSLTGQEQTDRLKGVDALITAEKDICIAITTADCIPILIFDPKKHVFAAIHAGWKGSAFKIVRKTAKIMIDRFECNPADLLVGIGPGISAEAFEVGDEVGEIFKSEGFDLPSISYRNKQTGKLHIDLKKANKRQLLNMKILAKNIEVTEICTYSSGKFFSARRQGIHSGRMLTGGILK